MTDFSLPLSVASLPVLHLKPGRQKRLKLGHPWVFSDELKPDNERRTWPAGRLVRVQADDGHFMGVMMFNPNTLIAGRLFIAPEAGNLPETFTSDDLESRLEKALDIRDLLIGVPYYRWIHAEADGLPGMIIDRFDDVLSVQLNCAGADYIWPEVKKIILELIRPQAIILKNDSPSRSQEGLPNSITLDYGTLSGPVELEEYGASFHADLLDGQKTGWFYDQRDNRVLAARFAEGEHVLDTYCYGGGFGIQAALAGAKSVLCVDRSEAALESVKQAALLNDVAEHIETSQGDSFDILPKLIDQNRQFGVVIIDPPAFVKNKKSLPQGLRAYRKLAKLATKLVKPGGTLFAASCSYHVPTPQFHEAVSKGISDTHRSARLLYTTGAAPDHPVHPHLPESAYLSGLLFHVD